MSIFPYFTCECIVDMGGPHRVPIDCVAVKQFHDWMKIHDWKKRSRSAAARKGWETRRRREQGK